MVLFVPFSEYKGSQTRTKEFVALLHTNGVAELLPRWYFEIVERFNGNRSTTGPGRGDNIY